MFLDYLPIVFLVLGIPLVIRGLRLLITGKAYKPQRYATDATGKRNPVAWKELEGSAVTMMALRSFLLGGLCILAWHYSYEIFSYLGLYEAADYPYEF